jgi:predicted kinase
MEMIIVVFGLPGTGKSYFSRHMADEIGAAFLNTDIVREELDLQGEYSEKSKELVYDQLLRLTGEKLSEKKHVIVDGTFHRKHPREKFKAKTAQWSEPLFFIEMRAGDLTVDRRIRGKRAHSEADFRIYRQLKHKFEELEEPHLILQNNFKSKDELIQTAKEYLYEQETNR